MTNQSDIERVVMRRVRTVRVLKLVFSNAALASTVCLFALYGIGREVWVAHVFQNAPHDLASTPLFYLDAFTHTRLAVQALSLVMLAALITLARETARNISSVLTPLSA